MRPRLALGRVVVLPRGLIGFCISNIQEISVYRRVARSFRSGMDIKEADEEDLRQVHAWLNPSGPVPPVSRNPYATDFVAKKGDRVIGFIQLLSHPEDHPYAGYWIFSLTVRFLYRGMGIGEELSRVVIEKAREEGAEEISLLVREDNQPAIKLYRKLGFEMKVIPALEERLEKERLSHGHRRVVMSKSLAKKG